MERRAIAVQGIVQGVGFRPFVHGLASQLHLSGFVANSPAGVVIEVEGEAAALERFERELRAHPPPLARVESVSTRDVLPRGELGFRITPSIRQTSVEIFISPDAATCQACLIELHDPADRRYRYPFINCTACGPRLTIITGSPYDRERTTMATFEMCAACRSEYEDPDDRRFHAEAIACPACGPRLTAVTPEGRELSGDPIAAAVRAIQSGRIVAIKGLGGFHLACDAANGAALQELRRRKHRDDKPFAVMVKDVAAARAACTVTPVEEATLASPVRPIVLLLRRAGAGPLIDAVVAPGNHRIGVMLPYTPLHHLLMQGVAGRCLVMTSGNRSDEPIATDNDEALSRLAGIADLFLLHDRPIRVRCDDSVVLRVRGDVLPVRRSRGYAPAPIALPFECRAPILAVGGQLKSVFAIGRGRQAFLSHHLGDLDDWLARQAFERDIALYAEMFRVRPSIVAHDRHPDYASTVFAQRLAGVDRVPAIAVQHHHAHVASCMAEHGLTGPVIGVTWDGAGLGTDDCVWGGEFLVGDYAAVARVGHFRYVPLPGGDRAAREPWRMALSHQRDAGVDAPVPNAAQASAIARRNVEVMIERRLHAPLTSSVGRLFDAVASICGVRHMTSFEGQAAMELESLAAGSTDRGTYSYELDEAGVVDTRPMIRAIAADRRAGVGADAIARRFHTTLVDIASSACMRLREQHGFSRVVLSGGVFLNAILAGEMEARLTEQQFTVYRHRLVPAGDGGLALGQLAVAAAVAAAGRES